jgi:hypothetical protein
MERLTRVIRKTPEQPDVPLAPASMPTPKGFKDYKLFLVDGDTGNHTELHAFNLVSGEDLIPPTPFVPAFAEVWSMNLVNGTLYSTTSQNCNGVRSGVYAMDLSNADRKVSLL